MTLQTVVAALREKPRSSRLEQIVYVHDLLRELVVRDMKLRYKRTVLGTAWSLLNPLAQVAVFSFVFQKLLPLSVPNYTAFLFTGLLAWTWFQTSLTAAAEAITENPDLIRRPHFPAAVLPAVPIVSQFLHFLFALAVFAVYLLATGSGHPFSPAALVFPLLAALQFTLTLGLAYIVATLHVPFRDTKYLLGLALMLLFYLIPVLYPSAGVPPSYRHLFNLNPLVGLLDAYRSIFLDARLPAPASLVPAAAAAVVLLPTGYVLFDRAKARFVEEL